MMWLVQSHAVKDIDFMRLAFVHPTKAWVKSCSCKPSFRLSARHEILTSTGVCFSTGNLFVLFSSSKLSVLVSDCRPLYSGLDQCFFRARSPNTNEFPVAHSIDSQTLQNSIIGSQALPANLSQSIKAIAQKTPGWSIWWFRRGLRSCRQAQRSWLNYYSSQALCRSDSRIDAEQQWDASLVCKQRRRVKTTCQEFYIQYPRRVTASPSYLSAVC